MLKQPIDTFKFIWAFFLNDFPSVDWEVTFKKQEYFNVDFKPLHIPNR